MATPQAPAEIVWNLVNAHAQARCMHMVAEFGVADALGEAPTAAAELADRTGMDADALDRILRLLAAHDVFAIAAGGYVHTPASELLRSTHPQSMRAFARMIGLPAIWSGFTEFRDVAVTGKPASDCAPARGGAVQSGHGREVQRGHPPGDGCIRFPRFPGGSGHRRWSGSPAASHPGAGASVFGSAVRNAARDRRCGGDRLAAAAIGRR